MTGGSDEARIAEGRKRGKRAGENLPMSVPEGTNSGAAARSRPRAAEDFRAPIFGFEIDKAGVGCVGVFGHPATAEPVKNVFGQIDPRRAGTYARDVVGAELVESVEAETLNPSKLIQALGADFLERLCFSGCVARVAIAEGRRERLSIGAEPHIINGPSIHADGVDSLGSEGGGATQPFVDS